jgi:hypothetical protein
MWRVMPAFVCCAGKSAGGACRGAVWATTQQQQQQQCRAWQQPSVGVSGAPTPAHLPHGALRFLQVGILRSCSLSARFARFSGSAVTGAAVQSAYNPMPGHAGTVMSSWAAAMHVFLGVYYTAHVMIGMQWGDVVSKDKAAV